MVWFAPVATWSGVSSFAMVRSTDGVAVMVSVPVIVGVAVAVAVAVAVPVACGQPLSTVSVNAVGPGGTRCGFNVTKFRTGEVVTQGLFTSTWMLIRLIDGLPGVPPGIAPPVQPTVFPKVPQLNP